jgi:hypothetical protein
MPRARDRGSRGPVSPVSITTRRPSSRSVGERLGGGGLDRIGPPMSPGTPSTARNITVCPSACAARRPGGKRARVDTAVREQRAFPSDPVRPSTTPRTPLPVIDWKFRDAAIASPRSRRRHDRGGERMLASALQARGETQHVAFVEARATATTRRPSACPRSASPSCRRPGCRPSPWTSSAAASLIEHAGRGSAAHPDHDRHGRGEPERAGAGDDQHRDGVHEGMGEARLGPNSAQATKVSAEMADHDRHEPSRDGRRAAESERGCAALRSPS